MTVVIDSGLLMPIALREPSHGSASEHPLSGLKAVTQIYREEATARAKKIISTFVEVAGLFERYHKPLTSQDFDALQPKEREYIFSGLVAGVASKLLEMKTLLSGVTFPTSLQKLERVSKDLATLTDEVVIGSKSVPFGETYRRVSSQLANAEERVKNIEKQIRDVWDTGSYEINCLLQAVLVSCIERAKQDPSVSISLRIQEKLANGKLRKDFDLADKAVIDQTVILAGEMHLVIGERDDLRSTQRQLEIEGSNLMIAMSDLSRALFDPIVEFEQHAEDFIEQQVKVSVRKHLDPKPSASSKSKMKDCLPLHIREATRGLGINGKGEVVAVAPSGNVETLVATLIEAIESNSAPFANGSVPSRRLGPVVRAALPLARERVAEREADRRAKARETEAAAAEQRAFVESFFETDLESSLPHDPAVRTEIRNRFAELYPDLSTIDARYGQLAELAKSLSILPEKVQSQYECYLLNQKELDRWVKDVKDLRSVLLRKFKSCVSLVMDDARNFLPSVIEKTKSEYA